MEDRLRHSEGPKEQYSTLESIINSVEAPIFSVDRQYRYTSFNRAHKSVMKVIYGKDIEIGRSLLDCMTVAEDREKAKRNLDRALAGEQFVEEAYSGEETRSRLYFEVSHSPVMTRDGAIAGVAVFAKDITERKRLEESLRRSEERFRGIAERSFDAIFTIDTVGRATYVSPASERILGYRPEELIGQTFQRFLPESEIPKAIQAHTEVLKGGSVQGLQVDVLKKDGSLATVEINDSPVTSNGTVVGVQGIIRDITERKRTEEKLREGEAQYRTLYSNIPVGLYRNTPGPQGRFLSANPAIVHMFGYDSMEEFLETKVSDLYEKPEEREAFAKRLSREGISKAELRLRKKDGTPLWGAVTARSIRDGQGNILYFDGMIEDITERKLAQQALQESETKYRTLVEQSQQGIVIAQGPRFPHLVFANPAMAEMLGYTSDELTSLSPIETEGLVHPDDRAFFFGRFKDRLQGKPVPPRYEVRGIRKDGEVRWLEISSNRIEYQGQPAIQGAFADITDRKRAEEALHKSEEKYRSLVENINDIVFSVDATGLLTYVSPAVERTTGYKADELTGQPFSRFIHPDDLAGLLSRFARVLAGELEPFEYRMLDKDGNVRFVRTSSRPLTEAGRLVGLTGVIIDITERRKMEAELEKYTKHLEELVEERTKRLREAERLAAIGQTAAMIGHDLRNPLQATASTIYLARKILKSPKARERKGAAELLDMLDEQVYYMDKIVSDLQDYAGPLAAEPVETNLPGLIRYTLSTARIPGTVKVSLVVQRGLSKIVVDPALMRRVLTNLVANALQAMPRGGRLTIRASRKRESVVMTVQDTGEGIARENMEKIFSPFFTTRAKGQGLGLPVCKRLVETQGGTITVKSKVGKGSTFTVEIPARAKPGARWGAREEEYFDRRR